MRFQRLATLALLSAIPVAPAHAAYLTYTLTFSGTGERVTQDRNGDIPIIYEGLRGATLTFGFNAEDDALNAGGSAYDTYFGLGVVDQSLTFQLASEPFQSNVTANGSGSACLLGTPVALPTSASEFKPNCGEVAYSYASRSGSSETFSGSLISVAVDRSDEPGAVFFSVVSYVPEPATWALMLAGFGLIGYALRRRPRLSYAT